MKSTSCLFALILFAAPLPAQDNVRFAEALDAGKALLEKGSAAEAAEKFQQSVAADAGRFEGYFYLAVASYRLGNLAAAEEYAAAALAKAPAAEQPKVREMVGVIGEKREFQRLEREGDEAMAKGLRAKAAESYRKAFLLFPKQGAVGLRAATLYADNLNQLLNAAALWQKVIAAGDAESAAAARQELAQRKDALAKLLKHHLGMMMEYAAKPAKAPLAQLEAAFPDSIELQVELAALAVRYPCNLELVVRHLSRAAALGVDVSAIRYRQDFIFLIAFKKEGPAFRAFITDAFGTEVTEAMAAVMENYDDRARTHDFLREAAAHGQAWAMIDLGKIYWFGHQVPENPAEAFRWHSRAFATGDTDAIQQMGECYYWGKGTAKDYARALELFRQAAARGSGNAMNSIGDCYKLGEGVTVNEGEAVRWWTRAVDYGNISALIELLEIVVRDKKFADGLPWARELAQRNEASSLRRIGWYVLGVCHRDGLGTEQNLIEARHCFEVAAKHEYPGAREALAAMP